MAQYRFWNTQTCKMIRGLIDIPDDPKYQEPARVNAIALSLLNGHILASVRSSINFDRSSF